MMHANSREEVEEVYAGDIAAGVGLKQTSTGDTLAAPDSPVILESMIFPEPVVHLSIEPKTKVDQEKLSVALQRLGEEDPTFQVRTDQETGQTVISGMGELHLEIIVDRLKREFKVEANQGAPQVAYKETLTHTVKHREVYKKQTGGRGKFADIQFTIGPADPEWIAKEHAGLQFENEVTGGNIPREFIPAVEKGFASVMNTGVLAGYPVDSMKVELFDGSYHSVDSDSLSFELCSKIAFRESAPKAKPVLLEPIMKVEVVTPDIYMGDVMGDLNKRRGHLEG